MLSRGNDLLETNDITGARLMFERAAAGGSAEAALMAGATYDPGFLAQVSAHLSFADTATAAKWYRLALSLGDARARDLLDKLGRPPAPASRR